MSQKEVERYNIIKRTLQGEITTYEASQIMNLSLRHTFRLKSQAKKKGAEALVHGNRGKESNNKVSEKDRKKIIKFLKKEKHRDFKPGFACEKLEENHNISYSSETIRKIMIEEGLWKPKKRKTTDYHCKRRRKDHYGQMVQFDGSYHDWFEKREKDCLLAGIDDATGTIVQAEFVQNENLSDIFSYFNQYFLSYGKPKSIYLDKLNAYYNNLSENKEENLTQFQRAMKELGIETIPAHSPQAKGRVERLFNTLQDRLIKEMRLKGISSREKANEYLKKEFIPFFNKKYGKAPRKKGNFHREVNQKENLRRILSQQDERVVQNDFCVRYENRIFQLSKKQPATVRKKEEVVVEKRMDRSIRIRLRGKYLNYKEITVEKRGAFSKKEIPWILPANTKEENIKVEN